MVIGVLALQGDFEEHISTLIKLNVKCIEVRSKEDLDKVNGLIIPGGESTTITKLLIRYNLFDEIIKRNKEGMCVYGTCAGAIVLAKEIVGSNQPSLGLIDISIKRNDYGRQIDSFESKFDFEGIGMVNGIFIRSPVIKKINKRVKVLAKFEGDIVALRENNILITTFHPELTENFKVHEYFVEMVNNNMIISDR